MRNSTYMPTTAPRSGLADRRSSYWNYPPQVLQTVTVMAVSSDDGDHRRLRGLFDHTNWVLHEAVSLKSAWAHIEQAPPPVILVSQKLSDGLWTDLFDRLPSAPEAPRVIVIAHALDAELYERVLVHGVFDVIPKPFQAAQLYASVSDAWRQWKMCHCRSRATPLIAAFA